MFRGGNGWGVQARERMPDEVAALVARGGRWDL